MKNQPIHKNLDTSFVNVSALVRYLRRRGFVGSVRVELSGYEADIFLEEGNLMRVREHDRIAGRVAEGEEALQRILIRSREPGGTVNVFQSVAEEISVEKPVELAKTATVPEIQKATTPLQNIKPSNVMTAAAPNAIAQTVAPKAEIKQTVAPKVEAKAIVQPKIETPIAPKAEIKPANTETPKPKISLPNLPFEFSNKVEAKAKQTALSENDWELLLNLTSELIANIDKTLAAANLDFSAAFLKARNEISGDYPFMNPSAKILDYQKGKIKMREQINAKLFTASILEILRRMLDKLGTNPKFSDVHRSAIQKILMLVHHRRPFYDKFSMTKPLEKFLGV